MAEILHLKKSRKLLRTLLIALGLILIILITTGLLVYRQYNEALKPLSGDQADITIAIEEGAGVHNIAELLEEKKVIRKASAFEWYVRLENVGHLQAGTYRLKASLSVAEIVGILESGKVATDLVTILPAQSIEQIKLALVKSGFDEADVTAALEPAQYADLPALAESQGINSLEGYLYPESFQKTSSTTPKQIIQSSLDEMDKRLTAEVRAGIKAQGLSIQQGIILASLVENEVSHPEERPQVAQVFLKRLRQGMRLESNATDSYSDEFNTYQIIGLPPAPLTNVSESSLQAVASPSKTDYLFFVTGADCVTRFSNTIAEHEKLVADHGLSTKSEHCD